VSGPGGAPLQQRIDAYWTTRAPAYDDYQRRPERRDLDHEAWSEIWAAALPPAPARVLDVGTGSGHAAFVVASLGHDVTGIDSSDGMLARARERAAAHGPGAPAFLRGDAVAPDPGLGTFDAVVGRYVMWTLRDPVAAVGRWCELLRPGGVVAVADTVWAFDGLGSLYGERPAGALPLADARSIEETAAVLEEAGLERVEITPLERVLELDRRLGVAPDHEVQLQHLVTGRVPEIATGV
jgi:SAM-dependent methyltransferase